MKDEHTIVQQVLSAQTDRQAADDLIEQYLPFIRSETAKAIGHFPGDGEDGLSIAMFAFYEAIMAYQPGKGSFLKLASVNIKNRLVDHHRKERRHWGHVSLDAPEGEGDTTLGHKLPDPVWEKDDRHEREAAQQEIAHFAAQLSQFDISLTDVAENCPKQDRTLKACLRVLQYARENPQLLSQLEDSGKLPMTELSRGSGVEKKTLERHRKYIVAILLAYTNGFEIIRGHLKALKGRGNQK